MGHNGSLDLQQMQACIDGRNPLSHFELGGGGQLHVDPCGLVLVSLALVAILLVVATSCMCCLCRKCCTVRKLERQLVTKINARLFGNPR